MRQFIGELNVDDIHVCLHTAFRRPNRRTKLWRLLRDSIKAEGLVNPITVKVEAVRRGKIVFRLVDGLQRLDVHKFLKRKMILVALRFWD